MLKSYGEVLMRMMGMGDKNMAREQDSGLKLIGTCSKCKFYNMFEMECTNEEYLIYFYEELVHPDFGCIYWAKREEEG